MSSGEQMADWPQLAHLAVEVQSYVVNKLS